PPATLQTILFRNFQSLPVINDKDCTGVNPENPNQNAGTELISNYPNPFIQSTTIRYTTRGGHTLVQIIDMLGRVLRTPVDREIALGTYTVTWDSGTLPTGVYYARLQNGPIQQVRSMLKVR
ncbi:MAG: T9SS type A sorting domain-containing protein, partial [Chitinophagaceae bacterium]|nr:T9SS type A sorting domain-containing protein [Chitinophagaceae bacterium]